MASKPEKEYSHPTFYACYLLRTVKPGLRSYVGSTPDPPRRIRQHNGEVKGGAVYTRRFKPWNMEMIVYGFPSKLSALQFEWALIHPEKSRHLRHDPDFIASLPKVKGKAKAGAAPPPSPTRAKSKPAALPPPLFPRVKTSNQPQYKTLVARWMLSMAPYDRLPLHVRLFSTQAVKDWEVAGRAEGVGELREDVDVVVDLGGVDGSRGARTPDLAGVDPKTGKLEVDDFAFANAQYSKLLAHIADGLDDRPICSVCAAFITTSDHLAYALCHDLPPASSLSTCHAFTHLTCLSARFLAASPEPDAVMPMQGTCPGCSAHTRWGDVIRACWARKRGVDGKLDKRRRKAAGKRKVESDSDLDSEGEGEDDQGNEDAGGENREEKEDVRDEDEDEAYFGRPEDPLVKDLLSSISIKTPPKRSRLARSPPSPPSGYPS